MQTFRRTTAQPAQHQSTMGHLLLKKRMVRHEDIERAVDQQPTTGLMIGELLVEMGSLKAQELTSVLAEFFGVPAFNPQSRLDKSAVALVPKSFAEEYLVLPFAKDEARKAVTVAVARPQNKELADYIAERTGYTVVVHASSAVTLLEAIADAYGSMAGLDRHLEEFDEAGGEEEDRTQQALSEVQAISEDAPVVKIVNILIAEGLRQRASDVHIEPEEKFVRIRYRVDGALREVRRLPAKLAPALASRLKVMANMDIVERHRSQDGQCVVTVDGIKVDIRLATAETIWGEKVVLRLLDRQKALIDLGALGMRPETAALWREVINVPFGLVVVSGPTGAGKTTTLYASINDLDRETRNITTIEDPVEYIFPGIIQMPIKASAGRTFASGLRAILRQDPDIILVGEVRDRDTAEIASQAALTGHAVFCSIHATDSVAALYRFLDMGVEGYLFAPALEGIIAQRLVRKICEACAVETEPSHQELALYRYLTGNDRTLFWRGAGCGRCNNTGYYGRIGIYEFFRVNDEIRNAIAAHAPQSQMRDLALATGMTTLLQAALQKIEENQTTISEVLRTVYAG